ncbi:MAG TPA: DinB family protein [Thermoanaerobaculia bacterium]|nr:DinB family protein [Thermoanaerobaculia bacterium]
METLERLRPRLQRLLVTYRIPTENAEDLLQGSLRQLLGDWEKIKDPEAFLLGELRRRCLLYWRTQRRKLYEAVDSIVLDLVQRVTPEQTRAMNYLRRHGTEAPVADLRRRVEETFRDLAALLREIPEESVRVRPRPGRWCVQEVVDHLVASHRPAVDELADLLRGVSPSGDPIPASLQRPDVMDRDWRELVDELDRVHGDFAALVAGAPDGPPGLARARVVMVVKARGEDGEVRPVQWVEELDWKAYALGVRVHALEHAAQIRDTVSQV